MKTGLVLEGGAMRGMFTCGVLDVLMEHNVCFDGIIGVSAGAAFGCNLKSHQHGRALRYNQRFAKDKRYCSLRSWLTTGNLFNAEFCYHTVPNELDIFDKDAFDADKTAYYVVCSDIETGNPVYKQTEKAGDEFLEWIRASASMPVCSTVVELDGKKMLDGGVTDSIPLRYFQEIGFERCIVVETQPADYRKKPSRFLPIMRFWMRRYPKFVEAMTHRHLMYNEEKDFVASEAKKGHAFVIRPTTKLPIGHVTHSAKKMEKVYQIGREIALKHIDEILEFMQ